MCPRVTALSDSWLHNSCKDCKSLLYSNVSSLMTPSIPQYTRPTTVAPPPPCRSVRHSGQSAQLVSSGSTVCVRSS